MTVDSFDEHQDIVEIQSNDGKGHILHQRSYYETGPVSSTNMLTEDMKKMIEARGINLNQISKSSASENILWATGESVFNNSKKDTEAGPRYLIDPCFEEYFGDDIDCQGYPPPPPIAPTPVPPLAIYAAFDSFVSPCLACPYVQMGSWSATSQNIDFIGVIGTSYRDYMLLGGYSDGGSNRNFAGVALSAAKPGYPYSPEVKWEQFGQHFFEHNGGSVVLYTSASANF